MKTEVLADKTDSLSFIPYMNNQAVIASSATIEIWKPDGMVLQASVSVTSIDSSTGKILYNLTTTHTDDIGENYVAKWTYVVSGTTYYYDDLFDIVKHRLMITVTDEDLLQEQAEILQKAEAKSGLTSSSSNTTLVDAELKQYANDYWNGGTITVTNPADGVQQKRNISDFAQSTGTITVSVAWTSNPTSSYRYIIRRGFKHKIKNAFDEIMMIVISKGYRPALILDSSAIKIPTIKKAMAMICRDYTMEAGDKWDNLREIYEKEFSDTMQTVVFQYDKDESGYISGSEKDVQAGNVRMRR